MVRKAVTYTQANWVYIIIILSICAADYKNEELYAVLFVVAGLICIRCDEEARKIRHMLQAQYVSTEVKLLAIANGVDLSEAELRGFIAEYLRTWNKGDLSRMNAELGLLRSKNDL